MTHEKNFHRGIVFPSYELITSDISTEAFPIPYNPGLSVFGLKYVQGATEDEGLNPSSDDVDLVIPSIGVGYNVTESLEVDVAGAYVIGFEKEYLSQKFDQDHFIVLSGAKINF